MSAVKNISFFENINRNVDTSRSGSGNVAREIKRLRRDLLTVHEDNRKGSEFNEVKQADKSPYLTDRSSFRPEKIQGSLHEKQWRKTRTIDQEVQQVIARENLKKLNII